MVAGGYSDAPDSRNRNKSFCHDKLNPILPRKGEVAPKATEGADGYSLTVVLPPPSVRLRLPPPPGGGGLDWETRSAPNVDASQF